MSAEHTPGPWYVGGHPRDYSGTAWREILTDAQPFSPSYVCSAQIRDAHLIAAAPEMLAALQWLDTLAEHLVIRHDLPAVEWAGLDRSLNSMVAHAKAAIAKARGTAA